MQRAVILLLAAVTLCYGGYVLQPSAFLKLPDATGRYVFNNGAANKAAYDPQENLLYVVGYGADVLHIVDMTTPANPTLLGTKQFDNVNQGLPDTVTVCRGGMNREFLAISFESRGLFEKGHVHLYSLLTSQTATAPLTRLKDIVTTDSYDPRSIAWTDDCTQLVVTSEGNPHEINGVFEDPAADIEVLLPSFGTTVDRRSVPIVESKIGNAKIRQVFQICDTGANDVSSRVQDLEPQAVTIDKTGTAYVLFSENNGIGKLDLMDPFGEMSYYNLGRKNWANLQFDGAYEDNGINLANRTVESFYQPKDLVTFEVDGKTWLATADTGSIRRYNLGTCKFDESVEARSWNQQFSDGLTLAESTKLHAEMKDVKQLGRLKVSKLRTNSDGWDPIFQGYDFVPMFGGRGFSILDPVDMSRVFDSGDDFERYFTTPQASEAQKAIFNGAVGSTSQPISSQFDRMSPDLGPQPSAIAATDFNGTQVLVIANGVIGGLYTYSVSSGPVVNFEGFVRRGQPGLSWNDAYARADDAVGEPKITDLMIIDDQNEKTVVAVSSGAGALSFYRLQHIP